MPEKRCASRPVIKDIAFRRLVRTVEMPLRWWHVNTSRKVKADLQLPVVLAIMLVLASTGPVWAQSGPEVRVEPVSGSVGTEVSVTAAPCAGEVTVTFADAETLRTGVGEKRVPSSVQDGTVNGSFTVADDDEPGGGNVVVRCGDRGGSARFEVTGQRSEQPPLADSDPNNFALMLSRRSGPPGTLVDLSADGCSPPDPSMTSVRFSDSAALSEGADSPNKKSVPFEFVEGQLRAQYTVAEDDAVGSGTFVVRCGSGYAGIPYNIERVDDVTRVQAPSTAAVDLALAWSRLRSPGGTQACREGCALLARDDDFADSLASATAQGGLGAPLLLTGRDQLPTTVSEELRRLNIGRVVIVGGVEAVSEEVAEQLRSDGYIVERVSGGDRVDTAVALARRYYPPGEASWEGAGVVDALVLRAHSSAGSPTSGFADALAAGRYGAVAKVPVLVTGAPLPEPLRAYLRDMAAAADRGLRVAVVGGPAAVPEPVVEQLRGIDGVEEVRRVAGDERAATAVEVARQLHGDWSSDDAVHSTVVDGFVPTGWAAGFAAAGAVARGPLLLTAGRALPGSTALWLSPRYSGDALACSPEVAVLACDQAAVELG